MGGFFDNLIGGAWEFLTPNLGGIALFCVGIGIVLGIIRKLIDQFGNIKVLIGIGAIVVCAWAVRYVTAPTKVEVRTIEKPVVVEKVVIDTRSTDALRAQLVAEQQKLAAEQEQKKGILQSLFGAQKESSAIKEELARRDSIEFQKKAEFDRWYQSARKEPFYEVEQKDGTKFAVTRQEIRDRYLVKSVYEGDITEATRGVLKKVTISVHDKDMKRFGKAMTYDVYITMLMKVENNKLDAKGLKEDLEDGVWQIYPHDKTVNEHFKLIEYWANRRR